MEESITIWGAFGGGVVSFLTPCVLPMVPVYIAAIAGPAVFEKKENKNRIAIFLHSLSFVIGFSIVFTLLGAAGGLLGFAIAPHLSDFYTIAGSVLIFFGLFMLVALKVPWLNFEKRLSPSAGRTTSYLRSMLTGALFTVAWTPCVAPILTSILALAAASETAGTGAYMLAVYSLGLGLPFLAIGAAFDTLTPIIRRIYRFSNVIYIIGGLLLITVGILILMNNMAWLRNFQFWIIWLFIVENILIIVHKTGWLGKLW
ncbi:cytochrome c biogenesis CcdA family protein [Chloroflexota bacterium]